MNKSKGFFEELRGRKVFREIKAYLFGGAAMIPLIWLVVNLLSYSENTTILITKIIVVIFISLFPSVFLFAYYHGESKTAPWSKAEKIGIPLNLITTCFLVFLFFNQDLSASETTIVEIEDEFGNISTTEIVKAEYRKRVLIFFFENQLKDTTINWLQYAIPHGCYIDLLQDQYISLDMVRNSQLKQIGFKYGEDVPLSKKIKIAREKTMPFFITGSFEKKDEQFSISIQLYDSKTGQSILKKEIQNKNLFTLIDEMTVGLKRGLKLSETHINESIDLSISSQLTSSIEALEYYTKANILYLEDDANKLLALKLVNKSIKEDPYFSWAYFFNCELYMGLNKMDSLDFSLDKTMENIDRFPGYKRYEIKHIYYLIKKMPEKSFHVLDAWVKKWPDNIEGHETLADYYWNQNMLNKAINEYEAILLIDPNEYRIYKYLSKIYKEADNYEKAIEYNKRYMNSTEASLDGCISVAYLFQQIGEFDSAKVYYHQAEILDPMNLRPKRHLLKMRTIMGDYDGQIEKEYYDLFKYCKSRMDSASIIQLFGTLYLPEGKIKKMRSLRDSVLNTFQNTTNLSKAYTSVQTLGELLDIGKKEEVFDIITNIENEYNFRMSNLAKSIEEMTSSNQSTLTIDNLRVFIGWQIYIHESFQKEYKKEIKIFLDFIAKLESTYGIGNILGENKYLLNAKLQILNNNYEDAIKILEENKIKSREIIYFLTLGRYYHHQKKYLEAKENFDIILKRSPVNPEAHYYSALLHYDWGKKDKAKEYLNKALKVWEDADEDYIYLNMATATAQKWK